MKFAHRVSETHQIGENILVVYQAYYLSETTTPRDWENVELFDKHGNKLWTVNGMQKFEFWKKNDSFVGANNVDDGWTLISWDGNVFKLDIDTGFVTYFKFVK